MNKYFILPITIIFYILISSVSCKEEVKERIKLPTNGLLLHYDFDSVLTDKSPNHNDGIIVGKENYIPSIYGFASKFSTSDTSYIKTSFNPSIESSNFTISFFLKSSSNQFGCILQRDFTVTDSGSYGYAIYKASDNSLYFYSGIGRGMNPTKALIGKELNDNQWHHITVSLEYTGGFTGFSIASYIDSKLTCQTSCYKNLIEYNPLTDNGTTIGKCVGGYFMDMQLDGCIDNLLIYNRSLSPDEIQAVFEYRL